MNSVLAVRCSNILMVLPYALLLVQHLQIYLHSLYETKRNCFDELANPLCTSVYVDDVRVNFNKESDYGSFLTALNSFRLCLTSTFEKLLFLYVLVLTQNSSRLYKLLLYCTSQSKLLEES